MIEESGLFENVVFHANGVGGRCMENLMREGRIDVALDMTFMRLPVRPLVDIA